MLDNIIIRYQLSEEFIEHFSDNVEWHYICRLQTLSESFIDKHQDKLC